METTWSSRITDLRENGMTLAEVGKAIELSPSAVSDIEQGRTKTPSGNAAVKLVSLHAAVCASSKAARERKAS